MKQKILHILDELGLEYKNYEHEAVFTCEESHRIDIPGKRVKSLLLRNKKPTQFYMIALEDYKKLDSKKLRKQLGENKLSFASEQRMIDKIGVKPGHVSPFANINDKHRDIIVIFDEELKNQTVGFHPGQNDNTVVLNQKCVEQYLETLGVKYMYLEL